MSAPAVCAEVADESDVAPSSSRSTKPPAASVGTLLPPPACGDGDPLHVIYALFTQCAGALSGDGAAFEGADAGRERADRGCAAGRATEEASTAGVDSAPRYAKRRAEAAREWRAQIDDDVRFVIDWFRKMHTTYNGVGGRVVRRV